MKCTPMVVHSIEVRNKHKIIIPVKYCRSSTKQMMKVKPSNCQIFRLSRKVSPHNSWWLNNYYLCWSMLYYNDYIHLLVEDCIFWIHSFTENIKFGTLITLKLLVYLFQYYTYSILMLNYKDCVIVTCVLNYV